MPDPWKDPDTGCTVTYNNPVGFGACWRVVDGAQVFVLPDPPAPGTSRPKRAIANYQTAHPES